MLMLIDQVLADFVASEIPGAIVLQGKWGVGKTFLWRYKVLPLVFSRPGKKRYSYVSLFGIGALAELKTALAVATEESDQQTEHNAKWFRRARRKLNLAQPMTADIVSFVPKIGGDLARFVEKFGYFMIRDRIICFDDIERRGDGLPLKDFLGLVSYLVEQRSCRIVVILNTGELGEHQPIWDRMREKVFGGELTYTPSIRETIDLGLSDSVSEPWAETLRQSLLKLSVSNIRLVRRTVGFMKRVLEVRGTAELRPGTIEHFARALAILVYSVHGQGEGAPPISHIMNPHLLTALGSSASNGTELSAEEISWRNIVQGYGLYLHTPLDKALLAMVQAGYPDPAMLIEAIEDVEQNASRYEAIEAFHGAWDLYHNTIAENGTEIVAAFARTWPQASASEHAQNLQAMVRILRLLDRADLATRFINQWVEERWGKRRVELSPSELHLFRQVEDEEILNAVEQAKQRPIDLMPLQAAFDELRSSDGYPEQAIASLAAATNAEILLVIDNNPGEDLSRILKKILELPHNSHHPEWAIAATKMESICRRIAARSPLNADRIKNWSGLEPLS